MPFVSVQPPERARSRFEAKLQQRDLALGGLPTIATQTFFVAPSSLREEVVLWLARSPQERDQLEALLRFWHNHQEPGPKPSLVVFSEEGLASPTLSGKLLSLFQNNTVWFVATTQDLRLQLPAPSLLKKHVASYSIGQMVSPAVFGQRLTELGYEFSTMVTDRGTFARRGGIIDVWPFESESPLRFDILDQRLESISTFNWKTQRKRDDRREIMLWPCALPKINQATLTNYVEEIRDRVRILSPELVELETLDPEAPKLLAALKDFRHLTFLPFPDEQAQFDFQSAPLFHRDFDQLQAFLKERADWSFWFFTSRPYDLRDRLGSGANRFVIELNEAEGNLIQGFLSQREKILLLTDWEIFGHEVERERRRTERADIIFVAELKPGDYVVHVDHGIGRFTGTTEQEVDGKKREYFVLSYADEDKLFVPVEMADKLSKYIGVAHPKLHRLSGGGWYQMTKKIKEETRAIAEELLKLYAQRETMRTTALRSFTTEEKHLAENFPYDVTPDQDLAIKDVEHDLRRTRPMDRLICGDVGFGKTEVAIRAALKAVMNKKQVAILSPTTILTQQHYDTFRERLRPFPVTIEVLSRFRTTKQQHETLAKLRLGQIDIIIGTHRLLQSDVQFHNLGLVIIDEEQRFGVEDKERLKTLRLQAHVLTLTATPIPRTLNLALSGIRDITVIETPPEGRKPIETHIEPYHSLTVRKALEREIARKGQVYYVYNHVETIHLKLRELQKLMPQARFGIAHGQLPEEELARIMEEFDRQKIDVLVCSTIIENGLDLPNVNTLIVDNATHFGLAQLYQLRGRIGRGQNQAYSFFLYHAKKLTPEARKRLQALLEARELGSGFQLALRDLEIRGTGSILGKKQHGHVAAVGLTLYTRLLAETIRELREGIRTEGVAEILIDLPLAIRIPKELEPNEQKRLSYYQKLALETTLEGLEKRAARLFRRKTLPEPVQNLIDVLKLKILSQPIGVTSIAYRKGQGPGSSEGARVIIQFRNSLIPSQIKALIESNGEWQFGENQIKIALSALDERWLEQLHKTFLLIDKAKHLPVPVPPNSSSPAEREKASPAA